MEGLLTNGVQVKHLTCLPGIGHSGHSSGELHLPSCTTVPAGQLQPGSQIKGQIGFWFRHVPSHPLHSLNTWPSIGHSVWSRNMCKELLKAARNTFSHNSKQCQWATIHMYCKSCSLSPSVTIWVWATLTGWAEPWRDASALMHHGPVTWTFASYFSLHVFFLCQTPLVSATSSWAETVNGLHECYCRKWAY